MKELFDRLFVPFPDEVKITKKMGKKGNITFVEWFEYVARAHTEFPQGYSKSVTMCKQVGDEMVVCVRISDNATGHFQDALGSAPADKDKDNYGGAIAEAEAQALKRAFANWGLGLEMYMEDDQFDRIMGIEPAEVEEEPEEEDEPEEEVDEEEVDEEEVDEEEDEEPEEKMASDRQREVLKVLGETLTEIAKTDHDKELKYFLNKKRELLKKGMTHKRAGAVISAFRAKLKDLKYEDPTKRDESN